MADKETKLTIETAINGYLVYRREDHLRPVSAQDIVVFPDFPSLSAWLKLRLKHGKGIEE